MPVKKGKSRTELADPRMGLQQRRAQIRRMVKIVDERMRDVEQRSGSRGRLGRLREMRQMLLDEIDRLGRAIDVLADHGPAHQVRLPVSGERIRLFRRKRR